VSQRLKQEREVKKELPGYPEYPQEEDIYNKYDVEENIDPEDISKTKDTVEKSKPGNTNEKNFEESGSDLDVPGSELDDEQEKSGSEDEENNYYSIGGDDHNDLD